MGDINMTVEQFKGESKEIKKVARDMTEKEKQLLNKIKQEEDEFWNDYMNEDTMPNDLLDTAIRVIKLQKKLINKICLK